MGKHKRRHGYPPWQQAFAEPNLRQAWLAVRSKKGRGGSDGETVEAFERHLALNLRELGDELRTQRYRPRKVTQLLVPKPTGGWRPLTLWTIRDRVAQRAVYNYLAPIFDARFLDCSHGFRPGRGTQTTAQAVVEARQSGAVWVMDADIKDCFGQMQNGRLLQKLGRWRVPGPLRQLVRHWLQAQVWNQWRGGAATAGTSQGGAISPLLCNLYLHDFDLALQKPGVTLVRYADDFVLLGKHKAAVLAAHAWAKRALRRVGLQLHQEKTRLTSFDEGFQFVGYFFVRDEMYRLK